MNALYTAAGRWLMDSWMRRGVLNLASVSFYPSLKLNEPASGRTITITLFHSLRVYSTNGNALVELYNELIREKQSGEGFYRQYDLWLSAMSLLEGKLLSAYAKFMEEK